MTKMRISEIQARLEQSKKEPQTVTPVMPVEEQVDLYEAELAVYLREIKSKKITAKVPRGKSDPKDAFIFETQSCGVSLYMGRSFGNAKELFDKCAHPVKLYRIDPVTSRKLILEEVTVFQALRKWAVDNPVISMPSRVTA